MPDQTENEETETDSSSRSTADDDRKAAYKERDAAKKRAREAEARAKELEDWKSAREAEQSERDAEAERKKNDFAALEQRLKDRIAKEEKRAADAEARILAREAADREAALVDAVMPKLGINNRIVVKGVLKALADSGVDIAPAALDEKTATDVAKQVREALGELAPSRNGGSTGTPGVNLTTKKPGEKPDDDNAAVTAVKEIAKRFSDRHR